MITLRHTLLSALASVLLLCCHSAIAEQPATAAEQVRAHLTFAPLIQGEFSQQRQLAAIENPLVSQGRFVFWRDNGLFWETQKPFYQGTTYLAESVLSWQRPGVPSPQTGINGRIQLALGKVLVSIFNFDSAQLEQQFDARWQPGEGEGQWQVELVPIDKQVKKALKKITLQGKQHVEQIHLVDESGQQTAIVLSAIALNDQPSQPQCLLFYSLASGACSKAAHPADDQ